MTDIQIDRTHLVEDDRHIATGKRLIARMEALERIVMFDDDPRRSVNRNAWRRLASRLHRLPVHCSPIYSEKTAMPQQGRYSATQICRLWTSR